MRNFFLENFLKNWWVILFFLVASIFYLQGIYNKNRLIQTLYKRREYLSQLKAKLEEEREELLLRIESEKDPDWIELVLKEKLGVKGEKELKVVFK